MKILPFESALPALNEHVRRLIRDGVYALFEIRNPTAVYALHTAGAVPNTWLLSESGEVVSRHIAGDLDIVDAVMLQ